MRNGAALVVGVCVLGAVPAAAQVPAPRLVRISTDTTATPNGQHATEVEPDALAVGSRIVSTFQVGRYFGGSAGATGYSTSTDAGRTWQAGLLPGITQATTPPGPSTAASDPVVAYDALHARWLVATLVNTQTETSLFISGSADGLTWELPATAIAYPRNSQTGTALDKAWITCDNGPTSTFFGHCYLAYTDIAHDLDPQHPGSNIGIQSSADGGLTWSAPVLLRVDADFVSPAVQPVVRPNGELVIVYFEDGAVRAIRSNDGAATFAPSESVSGLTFHRRPIGPTRLRGFSLPTATVDAAGNVYAAWPDCRFRARCRADDIVWSRSTGPGTWTRPRRVPLGPLGARQFTLPDLAADPASRARLALTYYTLNSADCTEANCLLNVYLVTSRTAGARWSRPRRLNPRPMRLTWIAQTKSGRMVGDYTGTVFSGQRVVSVHVQARAPQAGRFNEATYAFSMTLP
ncbi:sialidase family protein [soil metagenome]